jgi:biotin carboxyl carrier protein
MNGVVLEVPVVAGQEVKERDVLCVIEAMKMNKRIEHF